MVYIWEILLQAINQEVPEEQIAFIPAKTPNPYVEVSLSDINRKSLGAGSIEVNHLYRFSRILAPLCDQTETSVELRNALFNILTHYIAQQDLRQGLCRNEYYRLFLIRDILAGVFDRSMTEAIGCFTVARRTVLAEYLVRLYELGPSLSLICEVFRALFPNSMVYLDVNQVRSLLIYIGQKETAQLKKQVDALLSFFVPIDYELHLFWDVHFGIIGVEETMLMDDIYVY